MTRWHGKGGYAEVLQVGLPLVISLASTTVMLFTDRMFLGWYSLDALAATVPAGVAHFMFMSFFMGVSMYVNVFVAQYTGAGQPHRVGASLWQGFWFVMVAWVFLVSLYGLAEPLFALGGHPAPVIRLEVTYFRVLCLGSGLSLMTTLGSAFYSGRGLTRPVALVSLVGAMVNIPLDYAIINGWGPFPELGIAGAALATVTSWGVMALIYAFLLLGRHHEERYATRSAWRFDAYLMRRLLRFGLPGGVQFFLDLFAVTFFLFMVGRLGTGPLAATNIAFSVYNVAFLPMIGFHVAIETLVGQSIGAGRPEEGARATTSTMELTLLCMLLVGVLFLALPDTLVGLFAGPAGDGGSDFDEVRHLGLILMRFLAFYCLVDGMGIIYSGAIKGAGDTVFVMKAMGILSFCCLILPMIVLLWFQSLGLISAWVCLSVYVIGLAVTFRWRYQTGKWRSMRVI